MKILLCGSTRLSNAEKLIELLDELHEQSTITCLVNDGARGADLLASQWAHSKSITVTGFKVESAPTEDVFYALNDNMLNEEPPDLVLAVDPGPISDDLTRKASDRPIRTITYSLND